MATSVPPNRSPDLVAAIDGMMCQENCARTVHMAIVSVKGVESAVVSFPDAEARVWVEENSRHVEGLNKMIPDLVSEVEDMGYDAVFRVNGSPSSLSEKEESSEEFTKTESLIPVTDSNVSFSATLILLVSGIQCVKDEAKAEGALLVTDGVGDVQIGGVVKIPSLNEEQRVVHVFGFVEPSLLLQSIRRVGYHAVLYSEAQHGVLPATSIPNSSEKLENSTSNREAMSRVFRPEFSPWVSWPSIDISYTAATAAGIDLRRMERSFEALLKTAKLESSVRMEVDPLRQSISVMFDSSVVNRDMVSSLIEKCDLSKFIGMNTEGRTRSNSQGSDGTTTQDGVDSEDGLLSSYGGNSFGRRDSLSSMSGIPVKTKREFVFRVSGMSCGACAAKIERMVTKMPGVIEIGVSVMTHRARVVIDDELDEAVGPRDVLERIKTLGYGCVLESGDNQLRALGEGEEEISEHMIWRRLFMIALLFGLPVVFFHFSPHLSETMMRIMKQPTGVCHGAINWDQLTMFSLNTPLLIGVGSRFYRNAIVGAMNGSLGMDFLVMLGSVVTYAYSLLQLGIACQVGEQSNHTFFEAAGMLLLFVTAGKYIESYAKEKSASSVAELLKLQPQEALLVSGTSRDAIIDFLAEVKANCGVQKAGLKSPDVHDEDVSMISLDLIQKGDLVKVLPGARIPTDGYVVLGTSHTDESMITGESMPVRKERGAELFGSTVNVDGVLIMSVTSYGSDSALAQIVRLVETAQTSKAPVQDYGDRVAGMFTPAIIVLATITFGTWLSLALSGVVPRSWFENDYDDPVLFSLLFAISVVVISCPCALGLATPTAIMVGTTVAAQNGILIKGGSAFECAHSVDTIIFDKTGTLTAGKPVLTDLAIVPYGDTDMEVHIHNLQSTDNSQDVGWELSTEEVEVLLVAATAEQGSEHPLGRAILNAAGNAQITLLPLAEDAVVSVVGSGISCTCSRGLVLVGNRNYMRSQGIFLSATADTAMWSMEVQGKTAVCVSVDGVLRGILGIADVAKEEAELCVSELQRLGMDVWMLTGDNATTAEALRSRVGIKPDRVLAGMLPHQKAEKVRELQAEGRKVAMVGDGVNDSPALAQSDLGVAIGVGTQIAIEAASVVLIRSQLQDLVVSFDLARFVFLRIKRNLLWAVLYNFIAIPLAAGVWFPWTHMALPPQYAGLAMALSSISVVISSMMLRLYERPVNLRTEADHTSAMKKVDFIRNTQNSWWNRLSDIFSSWRVQSSSSYQRVDQDGLEMQSIV